MSWPTVRLGEVFEIARGGSPRPIDEFISEKSDAIPWISIRDASESSKYIVKTRQRIRVEGVSRSRIVNPGDFLLTNSMSFGRPYIAKLRGCIHDGWLVLSSRKDIIDQDFFYQMLSSPFVYAQFSRLAAGAVVKNLNIDLVKSVEVPLPPISEQRRIAKLLDRADVIRGKRKEAIGLAEELLRSEFLATFGDPESNAKRWPILSLSDVTSVITDGEHATPVRQDAGVMLLSARNIKNGFIDLEAKVDYIPDHEWARIRTRCAPVREDVLVSCSGTIGRVSVVRIDQPFGLVRSVAMLRLDKSVILPDFVEALLQTPALQRAMMASANKSAQANLFLGQIGRLKIIVPPLEAQKRFATFAARKRTLSERLVHSATDHEALFNSLVHRAFRGELSTKDRGQLPMFGEDSSDVRP